MIDGFVLLAIIILVAYTILTFTVYVSLGVNIALLIALVILISRDLKRKEMTRHYLIALLLTAIFFIFSDYGVFYTLLRIMEKNLFLSVVTAAFLLIYAFANISILLTCSIKGMVKKYR